MALRLSVFEIRTGVILWPLAVPLEELVRGGRLPTDLVRTDGFKLAQINLFDVLYPVELFALLRVVV